MAGKKVGKVLAEGEVTGHAHVLQHTDVIELEDGVRSFEVTTPDTVKHPEHGPIDLPPGRYESDRVRVWDHFEERARPVKD